MKVAIRIMLLTLALLVLGIQVGYSQGTEPYKEKVQIIVKEFSPKNVKQFLNDWEKSNKSKTRPAVDVSGDWCFVERSFSNEEEKIKNQKTVIGLKQDKEGKASGYLQVFYFENDEWMSGRRFLVEGKVSGNVLTGNLLAEEEVTHKLMFTFEGDRFEGVAISTEEQPVAIEIAGIRCSVR